MSRLLGQSADPAMLAAAGTVIEETIGVGEFSRLARLLESTDGEASIRLAFSYSAAGGGDGIPLLDGKVVTDLPVVCQRCLSPVTLPLATEFHLALLDDESQNSGVRPPYEPVLREDEDTGSRGWRLLELIEDELLLSLPMSPTHELDNQCVEIDESVAVEPDKQAPFAGLKDLLDHQK